MDPKAKALIEKTAGVPKGLRSAAKPIGTPGGDTAGALWARNRLKVREIGKGKSGPPTEGARRQADLHKGLMGDAEKVMDAAGEKKGSMQAIISDIIKGAEQNTFGRRVNVQTSWTPLDTAKTAGMLIALEEQGYSVKEAADYLGLTEAQVQDIVATVR